MHASHLRIIHVCFAGSPGQQIAVTGVTSASQPRLALRLSLAMAIAKLAPWRPGDALTLVPRQQWHPAILVNGSR